MSVSVRCRCGAQLNVREDKIGKQANCPQCKNTILLVPQQPEISDEVPFSIDDAPSEPNPSGKRRNIILACSISGALLLTLVVALILSLSSTGASTEDAGSPLKAYQSACDDFRKQKTRLAELRAAFRNAAGPIETKLVVIDMTKKDLRKDNAKDAKNTKEFALSAGVNPDRLDEQKKELKTQFDNLPEKIAYDQQKKRLEQSKRALEKAEDAVMESESIAQSDRYEIAQEIHKRATDRLMELRDIDNKLREVKTARIRLEFVGTTWKNFQSHQKRLKMISELRAIRMSPVERGRFELKELDKRAAALREFNEKTLEFDRLAQTPKSSIHNKLTTEFNSMWTTAEIQKQKRAVSRAEEFLKKTQPK